MTPGVQIGRPIEPQDVRMPTSSSATGNCEEEGLPNVEAEELEELVELKSNELKQQGELGSTPASLAYRRGARELTPKYESPCSGTSVTVL